MNYDEAIKELESIEETASIMGYQFNANSSIIYNALKTAKKEHELLGLYQHLYETPCQESEIVKRIEELERELK